MEQPLFAWQKDEEADWATVYEALVDAVETLRSEASPVELHDGYYYVVWETESRDYGTTKYEVRAFEFGEEPKVLIEGGRGGSYEIEPRKNAPPLLRYLPPDGDGWEEPLTKLAVLTEEFEFVEDEETRKFVDDAQKLFEES